MDYIWEKYYKEHCLYYSIKLQYYVTHGVKSDGKEATLQLVRSDTCSNTAFSSSSVLLLGFPGFGVFFQLISWQ